MLASRHHTRCRKLRQSMRATSTLKASSNQNGFEPTERKRKTAAATRSSNRVNQCAQRAERNRGKEFLALSLTAAGSMRNQYLVGPYYLGGRVQGQKCADKILITKGNRAGSRRRRSELSRGLSVGV